MSGRVGCGPQLHDDIGQRLALVGFEHNDVEQMARVAAVPEAEQKLRTIRQSIESIASDIHRISYNLHPVALAYIGLVGGLRRLCGEFSVRRRIDVEFTSNVASSVASPAVAFSLYRVTQECLTNVAKHSGSARAQVAFAEHPEALHRERVRRVGGDVQIASAPRRGVTVTVRVPLDATASTQSNRPRPPARFHEAIDER